MATGRLFFSYIIWHYTRAFIDLLKIWVNILAFLLNFFSFKTIIKTFFSPWHRLGESYSGKVDPFELFSSLIINILMRLVGIFLRTIILIVSLVVISLAFVLAFLTFIIWLLWPIIIIFSFVYGFIIIFNIF